MKKTTTKLKKEADRLYSIYIRNKYADDNGYVECVTCGVKKPVKEMQAGHYIPRSVLNLRYDDTNVHPQCYGCNVARKGNYPAYALFMLRTYGQDILDQLDKESHNVGQWKTYMYEDVISEMKSLTKQ